VVSISSYYRLKVDLLKAVTGSALHGPFNSANFGDYQEFEDSFQNLLENKDGLHLNFEIAAFTANDNDLKGIYREDYQEKLENLKKFIKNQQREGKIRDDVDAEILAHMLIALHTNMAIQLIMDYDPSQIQEQWEKTLPIILKN